MIKGSTNKNHKPIEMTQELDQEILLLNGCIKNIRNAFRNYLFFNLLKRISRSLRQNNQKKKLKKLLIKTCELIYEEYKQTNPFHNTAKFLIFAFSILSKIFNLLFKN